MEAVTTVYRKFSMPSLTEYYGRAKHSFGTMDPADMAQMGEDWMIAAATGVGVGLMSVALGGLDKKVFGFPLPMDGVAAGVLGLAGMQMGGTTGQALKLASVAAAGSAATRTFEKFFKTGFKVRGDLEDLGSMGISGSSWQGDQLLGDVGFGAGAQDALVEAAKYL
jgi:hypothetical protein